MLLLNSMDVEARTWGGGGWESSCLGELSSTLICNKCQNTSITKEESNIISLEIPDRKQRVSVTDCWKSFFGEEHLLNRDGWSCKRCQEGTFATKQFSMTTEPSLLIIHLKRFKTTHCGKLYKCDDPVVIPLKLPLLSSQYNLCGMARHHGRSIARGHYTAEVVGGGGRGWWRCDDRSIYKTIREHDRESRDAYILFYRKHRHEDSTSGS
jgi:ubiquitin C-terminal hydrolase